MNSSQGSPVRRLAAVWFADIVGYTALSSQDENAALDLVSILQEVAQRIIAEHEGHLVKFIGDAVFAEFTSTDRAARSALALNAEFSRTAAAAGHPAQLRIGLHVGEVVIAGDGDLYGDGINTASRLQSAGSPGQVVVSQDVWNQLRPRKEFRFKSLGERQLKGISGRLWMFSVVLSQGGEDAAPEALPRPGRRKRVRRVVRAVVLYGVVAIAVLEGVAALRPVFGLPPAVVPGAAGLLLVGLIVMATTAWVQSGAAWETAVSQPGAWSMDWPDLVATIRRGHVPALTFPRALLGGLGAFGIMFALMAGYPLLKRSGKLLAPQNAQAEPAPGIAIAPFEAEGASSAEWQDGLLDLLALNLDGAAGLRVIDRRALRGRLLASGDTSADPQTLARVGGPLGVRYAVTGHVLPSSSGSLEVVVVVHDLQTGKMQEEKVEGSANRIAEMVDRMGAAVLRSGVLPDGVKPLTMHLDGLATSSLPALREYLEGERAFRQSRWEQARVHYQQAVSFDSTFALALARLSLVTGWAVQPHMPQRDIYGEAAERFADRLPERDRLLARGRAELNRHSPDAIPTLERFAKLYPDDVEGWFTLGDAYYHLGGANEGDDPRFQAPLLKAIALDPQFGPAYLHLIEYAVAHGQTSRARELLDQYRRMDPGSPLLSSLAYTIWRTPPSGSSTAPASAAPEPPMPNPSAAPAPAAKTDATSKAGAAARNAYESALRRADQARTAAADAGAGPADGLDRADATRGSAIMDAAAGDFMRAARAIESARMGYMDAATAARKRAHLDSARDANLARRSAEVSRAPAPIPVAPAEPAAAPARRPAASAASTDEVVGSVLGSLRRAIEGKDLDALQASWMLSDKEIKNWQMAFGAMEGLKVGFDVQSARVQDGQIVATVRTTYDYAMSGASKRTTQTFTQELRIGQQGGRWMVLASRQQ